jgi:hypothetical protein
LHDGSVYASLLSAEMILLDPEDQQHDKLNLYVAGPTLRLPDAVAGRPSGLLPDYDSSQRQHNSVSSPTSSTISFRKYSLHNTVDSRFWRAMLYALAIYIALSVTVGVPLIVTNLAHNHKKGPPPWAGSDNAVSLSSPLVMVNSGLFSMIPFSCNMWNETYYENGLYYSSSSYSLDPLGSFSVRSSAWNTDQNTGTEVNGQLTVDINPDPSATSALFHLTTVSSSLDIRDECKICFSSNSSDVDNRGLSLYIPSNLTANGSLSFNITLLFPQSSSHLQLDKIVTYLPMFAQTIRSVSPQVILDKLVLEGMKLGIDVGSVWANEISVRNLIGPISGTFNASQSLKLDTVKGSISTHITVVQGPMRTRPTFFSLNTGESNITADVVLLSSPASSSRAVNFIGHVKNFDASITLNVTHDDSTPPVPLDLRIENNQAPCNVSLDSKFSGNYDVSTKLAAATVNLDSALHDYTGTGQRQISPEIDTEAQKRGWVGWGDKPAHFNPRQQGQVILVSSLSPVTLSLGS